MALDPAKTLDEERTLDQATVVEPHAPATGAQEPSGPHTLPGATDRSGTQSHTRTTVLVDAADAMHAQEVGRTRAFTRVSLALAVLVGSLLPFVGGDSVAKAAFAIGLGVMAAVGAWLLWVLRDDAGYSVGRALVFGYSALASGFAGIYFFGMFSPAVAVVPFGLFFFSTGKSIRATVAIWLTSAVGYALLTLTIVGGVLADRGIVRADRARLADMLAMILLVEVVFLATFLVARATRRVTIEALERHERAVRGVAQRDALLKEARQELERALAVGGVGRLTDEVLGSFRLGAVLGRGGMGEVYEAVHVSTREAAAIKVLHSSALAEPEAVRRFLREAKVVASLAVPNVVRVFEIGGLEAPLPYIAMERLRGRDLADVLRAERRLAAAKVVTLVREAGHGLAAAHDKGVVHRDVKPRNLYLAEGEGRPTWKVLDFGVSKLAGDTGTTLTRDRVVGTPSYMAPEQARGREVSGRTDLYALAVIAYRALTGRPAYTGDGVPEILYKVVHTMPPRPSDFGRLHHDVDLALAVGLAKDSSERFATAGELADALEAAVHGDLAPSVRARGERLVASHPWGKG